MPIATHNVRISAEEFERIYRENYESFLLYADTVLRAHGSQYVSVSGRAEDAVQEMCAYAWEHRDKMAKSKSPVGWMYKALVFKAQGLLREDRLWTKRLLQISVQYSTAAPNDFQLNVELLDLIPQDDYLLLKALYLDGYKYTEVAEAMGITKSALAMRVNRAKAHIRSLYCSEEKKIKNFQKKCEQSPPGGHYIAEEAHGDGT